MASDPATPPRKQPGRGKPFTPREVFGVFGFGVFIPERVAASRALSMTAKVCYGHLVRLAGKKDVCWPSYENIAECTGLKRRQAIRGVKELTNAGLIRPRRITVETGRQTSNEYEFTWGPILQGEGDTFDTLPSARSDKGRMANLTPTRVSETTPLEVKNINHHQGSNKERSSGSESTVQDASEPESTSFSKNGDDGDLKPTEYATAKDELKAIYLAKTGEPFRAADLDAIEVMLFRQGVTWEAFVADARGHSWDRINNPVGFLKNRAKNFRGLTGASSRPVTAVEAAAQAYRCQSCGSRVPGQGAQLVGGREVPCVCASPEYIERQRARGIFAAEDPE
jgi:hypothetical protein